MTGPASQGLIVLPRDLIGSRARRELGGQLLGRHRQEGLERFQRSWIGRAIVEDPEDPGDRESTPLGLRHELADMLAAVMRAICVR